jgi:hypothetical protein
MQEPTISARNLPPETVQDAERLLDRPPAHEVEGMYQFNEMHQPAKWGRTIVKLSRGVEGGEDAYEAYSSQVDLVYDRNGRLKSVTGAEYIVESLLYPRFSDHIDHLVFLAKEILLPKHRTAQKEHLKVKVSEMIAEALLASPE